MIAGRCKLSRCAAGVVADHRVARPHSCVTPTPALVFAITLTRIDDSWSCEKRLAPPRTCSTVCSTHLQSFMCTCTCPWYVHAYVYV